MDAFLVLHGIPGCCGLEMAGGWNYPRAEFTFFPPTADLGAEGAVIGACDSVGHGSATPCGRVAGSKTVRSGSGIRSIAPCMTGELDKGAASEIRGQNGKPVKKW